MPVFTRLTAFLIAVASPAFAQFHLPGAGVKSDSATKAKPASAPAANTPAAPVRFDYYVLSLAWTPGKGSQFVVRGFPPETNDGPAPELCGSVKPLSKSAVSVALPVMPNRSLIQQEWAKHGSCTGLSGADYFNGMRYARSQVQIPVQLTSLDEAATESPLQIEAQFSGANPGFPAGAFKVGCEGKTFTEVRACFDLQFKPRECTAAAGECAQPEVSIRPGRQ